MSAEGGEDAAGLISSHVDAIEGQPGTLHNLAGELRRVLQRISPEDEAVSTPPELLA